jgi:AcrR family transcriptional regulator
MDDRLEIDEVRPSANRILEAAEELFAQEGYEPVSLRQLIAAAQVSPSAFYRRFPSKSAVIAELTAQLFMQIHEAAGTTMTRAKTLDKGIDLGVDLLCDQLKDRRPLVRVILSEAGCALDAVAARRVAYKMLTEVISARLSTLAKAKRVTVPDPDALAWALVGALEMQVTRWAVWGELELEGLRKELRATARAILPKETK